MEKKVNRKKITELFAEALMPAVLTLAVFLFVLFVKGIYPFGSNLIDYYDMGQTNAPLYYHIWDFLHGKSPLFFDWYINMGQNLSMGSAIQWNISPFNLYFLFIPRNLSYVSLSVFMGLHLFFMAFNMGIFLKAVFPDLNRAFLLLSGTAYGLSGYTLTHYTIPTYLDTAVFLPLFALSLMILLKEGRNLPYILMLGFMTALSYYLGFMHLIYVLLFSGVYIIFMIREPEERKKRAAGLGIGTVSGLLISSFMLLPSVLEMTLSSRFNSNLSGGAADTLISILNSIGADQYYNKYFQLHAMGVFILILIYGAVRYRKEGRFVLTVWAAAFIPCALIIFESINILWHFGTYYHYPIRCGYLIPFSLIASAAAFVEKTAVSAGEEVSADKAAFAEKKAVSKKVYIIQAMLSPVFSVVFLLFLENLYKNKAPWDIKNLFKYWAAEWLIVFFMLTIVLLILRFGKGLKDASLLSSLISFALPITLMGLMFGAYEGYGIPEFRDAFFGDPEQSGEYILKAEAIMEAAEGVLTEDADLLKIRRIKNPDTDLNANFGMVMGRGTVTGWANTATGEMIKTAEGLGYSTHFMRILDSGGTFLSDSAMQVKDILSKAPYDSLPEDLYTLEEKIPTDFGEYRLYHNNAELPFSMAVTDEIEGFVPSEQSIAENNNTLYRALSGSTDSIAETLKVKELSGSPGSSEGMKRVSVTLQGRKALYLYKGKGDAISVNGRVLTIPTIGDMENTAYPAWFNSNLILLGIFNDETVTLECPEKSRLVVFDVNKFLSLSEKMKGDMEAEPQVKKASLSFGIKGDGERNKVLIPLAYSPGWSAKVNGEKKEIEDCGGLFMTLPISEGENSVEIGFTPPGLMAGVVVSLLTLLFTLLFSLSGALRNRGEAVLSIIKTPVYFIFTAVFYLTSLFLYVIPICWCIVHVILKRL